MNWSRYLVRVDRRQARLELDYPMGAAKVYPTKSISAGRARKPGKEPRIQKSRVGPEVHQKE